MSIKPIDLEVRTEFRQSKSDIISVCCRNYDEDGKLSTETAEIDVDVSESDGSKVYGVSVFTSSFCRPAWMRNAVQNIEGLTKIEFIALVRAILKMVEREKLELYDDESVSDDNYDPSELITAVEPSDASLFDAEPDDDDEEDSEVIDLAEFAEPEEKPSEAKRSETMTLRSEDCRVRRPLFYPETGTSMLSELRLGNVFICDCTPPGKWYQARTSANLVGDYYEILVKIIDPI